jgi:hypothetical protein
MRLSLSALLLAATAVSVSILLAGKKRKWDGGGTMGLGIWRKFLESLMEERRRRCHVPAQEEPFFGKKEPISTTTIHKEDSQQESSKHRLVSGYFFLHGPSRWKAHQLNRILILFPRVNAGMTRDPSSYTSTTVQQRRNQP